MSSRIKGQEIQIGNNFVLPIEQTKVTAQQAKVRKIIEETDVKVREILDGAENQSQTIVQTANNEADKILENARKQAEQEKDAINEQGYNEGFAKGGQDGLENFQRNAAKAIQALDTLAANAFEIKKNIIDSATIDIVELVLAIADKVCHIKLDKEVLEKITLDAIRKLDDKEKITIYVNPELVNEISNLAENFKEEFPKLQSIKIIEDNSVSPDGVIVENLKTRLDSRVSTQISEIAQQMLTGINDELEQK